MRNGVSAALIAVVIVAVALFRVMEVEGWSAPAERPACMQNEDRDRISKIASEAIDQAMKEHIVQLFEVWIRDKHDQPKRAQAGMADAINAYLRSRSDIRKWAPPICP